ncbi:phosphatidate cytidylyltransferase [uncultured Oscillibacter sp.]|uniref:phosphatidate cytidylyltransferase n=1 Tax=uncultured Oscillibacter sp. TaxID=876091 RepID=UPI001F88D049|nr:phosphatidate cytidylyltransferase [uncultured Oscillibacter sp.]HJB53062.1 phosphatidate cytidylyltransferase [Candidatus Oscillibacter pullicola]
MFKRVMVAVVGLPLLILILGWAPSWATMLLLAAMCAIGAWELMHAAAGERGRPLIPLTVIAAALVPVCVYAEVSIENTELTALPVLPLTALLGAVLVLALFVVSICRYGGERAVPFAALTTAIFAGLVFPLMLSCMLRLRMVPYIGMLLVFFPLCISFGSDTFAFFAGLLFGKHKLTPVSPKKTVEGAIGGLIGGVIGMMIMPFVGGMVISDAFMSPTMAVAFGLLGSVVSQIGDLSFSVIKREFGVKDYGNLLPGHGGILDRFDSVTFVAPFVWLLLELI